MAKPKIEDLVKIEVEDAETADPTVSRSHARLRLGTDGVLRVEDLGSRNGTTFLGARIEAALHDRIYRMATVDPGTEVFNRRYLFEVAATLYGNARRGNVRLAALLREAFTAPNAEKAHAAWRAVADAARETHPKLAQAMDEAENDVLAYMDFPGAHRSKLHSTNGLERLNKEVKRRADVVGIFPNEASIVRLVGAVLMEANDEWQLQHRYLSIEALAEISAGDHADKYTLAPPAAAHPASARGTARPTAAATSMLCWLCTAPFGRPVVPDVKRMSAMSSGATAAGSRPSPARRRGTGWTSSGGICCRSPGSAPPSAWPQYSPRPSSHRRRPTRRPSPAAHR